MTDMAAPAPEIRPAELAAYLAARMCHDFISPASAIVSGLDLLGGPHGPGHARRRHGPDRRLGPEAFRPSAVHPGGVRRGGLGRDFDARELEKLAQGVFAHMRAELDWQVQTPAVNKPAARTLLNLAQMAGAALPTGGKATVHAAPDGDMIAILVEATGPRARLRAEVLAGIRGEPMGEGLHGHWVQARYVHLFVGDAGGRVSADVGEEKVTFAAAIPA